MQESIRRILPYMLKPFSWAYGFVTDVRNWMFDNNLLKVEQFDVPVISVGNITVGGTGKTPHVEFLVNKLSSYYKIAVLSRGYKRKTKGFVLANGKSTPDSIGDEPLQIFRKYGPRVKVAVSESRRKGIKELLRLFPDLQLIILDDSFQHRYVKPKVNILLMDYNRPIYEDEMLPLGRLRETHHSSVRADMVVVTKCPVNITPIAYRLVSKNLELMPYQKLYFSTVRYGLIVPVFPDDHPYHVDLANLTAKDTVIIVTGIANPRGFIRHFKHYPFKKVVCHFPDHHDFTRTDLETILKKFQDTKGERKIILTTEKDAIRMSHNPYYPLMLKPFTFYIPISVAMLPGLENNDIVRDIINELG